jgi:hypothetical protein
MNALIVGSEKDRILDYLPDSFLIIDDGPIIDQLEKGRTFDVETDSFNPLKGRASHHSTRQRNRAYQPISLSPDAGRRYFRQVVKYRGVHSATSTHA